MSEQVDKSINPEQNEDEQMIQFFGFSPKKFYEDLFNVFLESGLNLVNASEEQTIQKLRERFKTAVNIDKLVKEGYDDFYTNVYIPSLNQHFDDFELYTFNNIFSIQKQSQSKTQSPPDNEQQVAPPITLTEEEKKQFLEDPSRLRTELDKTFEDLRQVCPFFFPKNQKTKN